MMFCLPKNNPPMYHRNSRSSQSQRKGRADTHVTKPHHFCNSVKQDSMLGPNTYVRLWEGKEKKGLSSWKRRRKKCLWSKRGSDRNSISYGPQRRGRKSLKGSARRKAHLLINFIPLSSFSESLRYQSRSTYLTLWFKLAVVSKSSILLRHGIYLLTPTIIWREAEQHTDTSKTRPAT